MHDDREHRKVAITAHQERNEQTNAFHLLKAICREPRGSAAPVKIEEIYGLQMRWAEVQAAFHYLKEKRLIDAGVCYSARSNAAGFEALQEAEATPDEPIPAFPAITYHYYRIVHVMSEWEGGATDWQIMEAQAIAVQELSAAVGRWIEQLPCVAARDAAR
jgi:hypothetical protein